MTLTAFGHSQTEVGPGDDVEDSLAGVEVAVVHECNLGHRPLITPCRLERNRGDDVDCALVEQLVIKKEEEEKEKGGGKYPRPVFCRVCCRSVRVCNVPQSKTLSVEALSLLCSNRPYVVSVDVKHKQSGPFMLFSAWTSYRAVVRTGS